MYRGISSSSYLVITQLVSIEFKYTLSGTEIELTIIMPLNWRKIALVPYGIVR